MELRSNAISYDGHNARLLIAIDRTAEDLAQLRRDQALARVEEAHELARIGAWELDPSTGMGRYSNQVYRLLGRRPPEARRWHRFDELLVPADPATATQTEQLLADLCSVIRAGGRTAAPAVDGRTRPDGAPACRQWCR
jgi:PAS domain-containing protein